MGITINPSVTINDKIFTDHIDGESIFRNICSAYHVQDQPEVCKEGFNLQTRLGHISDFKEPEPWFMHSRPVLFVMFLCLALNIFIIVFCLRKNKKERNSHMQIEVQ